MPKDIREFLGLQQGKTVVFEVRNKEVVLKQEEDPKEFLKDFLNTPKLKRTKKTIKEMILEQYDEEIP
ncbi:AbrB/MazE/SpoVT family DNA-binding domain-containing protein [Candidatus Pacearchaeota archaeon]|nr:AbrB/MazE/SpoVT family DNA-binding domain-containing protein [Candidatus Pacearchaeota archaeon]